jgi:hypothetical protein
MGDAGARHDVVRPAWTCVVDGDPWPCARAREDLAAEYVHAPTSLTVLMALYLGEAIGDREAGGWALDGGLHARFLAWVRPAVDSAAAGRAAHAGGRLDADREPPTTTGRGDEVVGGRP